MTPNTGMSAMKAKIQIPRSDMNPGDAIESKNADATKTTTSEHNVLRFLPAFADIAFKMISPRLQLL